MLRTRSATAAAARFAALALLALLAALALVTAPARATIVLLSTSSSAPSPQDANLYDWAGQWTSALDRAAPLPGQLPAWQVNVGLYGDWYQPPNSNIVQQNPTCQINLQIAGAPINQTVLNPCVWGPRQGNVLGSSASPVPELLTPNLAAADNGPHTVAITAFDALGGVTSSTTFNVDVDNTLPSPTSMVGAVGWQRGGELVTSTATTNGPSGIKGQDCAIGSSTASWYPGATAQLAVTGDGQIPVRCSSENNAGVPGPITEYDALLDNTPPTGFFAPRDPNNPAQATIEVADSLSGLAGGQIQIQTASGWRPLATRYSAAIGQLTAPIPDDGSLPDGNYQLRAVVSDAVGNTATITSDQNSTPEVITVPLRIVTRLPVGRSHALVKRCTLTRVRVHRRRRVRNQRPAARLVRRCSQVPVPHKAGIVRLHFKQNAAVNGIVQTADGEPVVGARVLVSQQAPGWTNQRDGVLLTNRHGEFTYNIHAGPSRTITFTFRGTGTLRPSAGTTTVRVAGGARINVTRHAQAGRRLRISGRILGGYIPPAGVLVQLQYRVAGVPVGWAPFENPVHTSRKGRWSLTFPLAQAAAGYTYVFRAMIASQSGWPFMTAHSNAVARRVT